MWPSAYEMFLLVAPFAMTTLAVVVAEWCDAGGIAARRADPKFRAMWLSAARVSARNVWAVHALLLPALPAAPYTWPYSLTIMVIVQHLLFYCLHRAMHEWWYALHEYHHRFRARNSPVAAMAVSAGEYLLAYALPVVGAVVIGRPSPGTLTFFVTAESLVNVYIHCAFLQEPRARTVRGAWGQKWIVTPDYHGAHHAAGGMRNLAAPLFTFADHMFS